MCQMEKKEPEMGGSTGRSTRLPWIKRLAKRKHNLHMLLKIQHILFFPSSSGHLQS